VVCVKLLATPRRKSAKGDPVLIEHPDVKAISFVGSTPVAKAIYENATRYGKRVQSLGGAKNHTTNSRGWQK